MHESSGLTRISIRLADGKYFPVFRHGDPDTRNMTLVPARTGQAEAEIHFFHHALDGSSPVGIGVVRIPDLPVDSGMIELHLDAVIAPAGMLSVSIRHVEGGHPECLDMEFPEQNISLLPENMVVQEVHCRPVFQWLFGILFVVVCLALVFWLAVIVTGWGRQFSPAEPVSGFIRASSGVATV